MKNSLEIQRSDLWVYTRELFVGYTGNVLTDTCVGFIGWMPGGNHVSFINEKTSKSTQSFASIQVTSYGAVCVGRFTWMLPLMPTTQMTKRWMRG